MTKRILVTGAGRGIGFAIAKALAVSGYELVLITKTIQSRSTLVNSLNAYGKPPKIEAYEVDISNSHSIDAFVSAWQRPLWGIVNNAGICRTLPLRAAGDDPWDEIVRTNLEGPYRLTKGLLPLVTRPGRVVNIASQLGKEGRAGYSAYSASKFGLIGMTKCWAKELGSEGITVNAVCPGWVDTEMSQIDMARMAQEKGMDVDAYYREICGPLELKRFNTPQEVADLVLYLLSDKAAGVTGRDWLLQTVWNQE